MLRRRRLLSLALSAPLLAAATRAAAAADASTARPAAGTGAVRRGYFDGPYGQIHFREAGAGDAVILCHGAGQTSHVYVPVLESLARAGYRAIAFDTPGAGLSDAAPGEPSMQELSLAIDAALAYLGVPKATIAGNHTGGNMASVFAGRRPDATRALVISGPEAGFHYTNYAETKPGPATPDGAHVVDLWRKLARYRAPSTTPEQTTEKLAYELLARPTSWQLSFATGRFDAAAAYEKVRSPTLVVCGVLDGLYRYMETTRKLRPDFVYRDLRGAGLDEFPLEWAEAVIAFLRDLERR
jgi:pimeloyl-ACP methyl ester carboxylesterase